MRKRRLSLEKLESRQMLDASGLRITEFMASNDDSLLDADGDDSDWIELYNSAPTTADLSGLFLTDDPDELNRWAFPTGAALEPGAFLIVFASGKDTVLADNELHASFKLGAGGEYLALVDQDGTTVIDSFAPEFPPQITDVSYGREMEVSGSETILLNEGAPARAVVPSNQISGLTWTEPGFDDSSWTYSGATGFGYENSPGGATNYTDEIATTVPSSTTGLYLRVPFEMDSLADIGSLSLDLRYDDGFVAYLNGHRIASANAPDSISSSSLATAYHDDTAAEQFQRFDVSPFLSHLQVGANVLAIHALNLANSSDMLIEPRLVGQAYALTSPEAIGHFSDPTPGYGNGADSILGFATEPEFSVPHGFYDTSQTVAISTETSNAKIVYTTDGSTPVVDANLNILNGTLYESPLSISSTTSLRAGAFRADYEASPITTQTYLFVDDVVGQQSSGETPGPGWPSGSVNGQQINYGMDPEIVDQYGAQAIADSLLSLTTVSISTDLENLFDPNEGIFVNAQNRGRDWERAASFEMIWADGSESGFQVDAGLRIRGGYSRQDANPKHAFRFYFRSEYGDSKLQYPIFGDEGVDEFDVLDLRTAQNYSWSFNGNNQNTFVRDVFARDLQRDLDQPYTRSRYHHLYINGVYWGIFMTQERVEEFYGESYLGGDKEDFDVVKADAHVTGGTEVSSGNDLAWRQLFDLGEALAHNPTSNADNYFTMQGLNPDGTRNLDLPVLLDLDNLIDYMSALFYTGAFDNAISSFLGNNRANNWFGIRNREDMDQGFQFFMHDTEHSLGAGGNDYIDRTGPFNEGNEDEFFYFNPQYLHQDLLVHPEYRMAFADRIRNDFFDDGPMTPQASRDRMQTRVDEVHAAIIAEAARWGDSKRATPFDRADWQTEINSLLVSRNAFFINRTNTVLGQLQADDLYPSISAPQFSLEGGLVAAGTTLSITNPGQILYVTTDGSDPRQIGGAVNPNAQDYDAPITINSTTTISARAFASSTGTWSALTTAEYIVPLPGDYDQNGEVNPDDYLVWRASYGSTTDLAADGNGDGVVGAADYTIWRDNLGAVALPPIETPVETVQAAVEPASQPAASAPALAVSLALAEPRVSTAATQTSHTTAAASDTDAALLLLLHEAPQPANTTAEDSPELATLDDALASEEEEALALDAALLEPPADKVHAQPVGTQRLSVV